MVKITGYYQLPGQMPQKVDFDELIDKAVMIDTSTERNAMLVMTMVNK